MFFFSNLLSDVCGGGIESCLQNQHQSGSRRKASQYFGYRLKGSRCMGITRTLTGFPRLKNSLENSKEIEKMFYREKFSVETEKSPFNAPSFI